jgi:hypothetical protein
MVARFIVPALLLPALMAAAPYDAPAVAATTLSFDSVGDTGRFGFSGIEGVAGTENVAAVLTLTLRARTANSFLLDYAISNDTGGSFDKATLLSFGFDIAQPLFSAVATGVYDRTGTGAVPGFGPVDLCVLAGGPAGVCNGNSNAGVKVGEAAGRGTLTLRLSTPSTSLELDNSFVRWGNVRSKRPDIKVPEGISEGLVLMEPAPEPATWAMMIAGFGLVGTALRQKPRSARKQVNRPGF